MSTGVVPLPPAAPTNPVSNFLKHHEKLLIFVFGFILLWVISGKIQTVIAEHDSANWQKVTATLVQQVEQNKQTTALVAQQAADFKALNSKLQQQDAALRQMNLALVAELANRQKMDSNLTVPELVLRWGQLVPGTNWDGSAIAKDGTLGVSPANAHATVAELEKVPTLVSELDNEKIIERNTNTLLTACNGQVVTLNTLIAGKDAQLKDADNVCSEKRKVDKDMAAKSKRRWAIFSAIGGFVFRQIIKSQTGF